MLFLNEAMEKNNNVIDPIIGKIMYRLIDYYNND